MHAYLPSYNTVTIFHLRDLVGNKRKLIKCTEVKYINIPYYDTLSIEKMLEFAKSYQEGMALMALPQLEREVLAMPREYLGNVLFTMIGDPFQGWVDGCIAERNAKVTDDKNLAIQMDPEIAETFKKSTSVSRKFFCL